MRAFLLANLAIVAIVLIGAAGAAIGGMVVNAISCDGSQSSIWFAAIAAGASLVGIFYCTRWLYGLAAGWIEGRR